MKMIIKLRRQNLIRSLHIVIVSFDVFGSGSVLKY